ncbi:MAG TPA: hypothetical protein DCQ37_01260 [Desulfobacteraceae bacterium]|nr:hypothetical protein [Desulfobacteraceae bacterium]
MLKETAGITFRPTRKKNSLRATDSYIERKAHRTFRKRIETAFSKITALFPKCIHAVFGLKVIAFIIAAGIRYLMWVASWVSVYFAESCRVEIALNSERMMTD